jgi:hypothetical protein
MLRARACRRVVFALLIAGVAGCHSATPEEQRVAAQNDLVSEAMALQRCESASGYGSKQCDDQRATYNRDLSAFRVKYVR